MVPLRVPHIRAFLYFLLSFSHICISHHLSFIHPGLIFEVRGALDACPILELSRIPGEEEVMFPAGTVVRVISVDLQHKPYPLVAVAQVASVLSHDNTNKAY